MSWPLSQDYNEAIQSPATNFTDADLRKGEAVCSCLGLPIPSSGNFADVYQVRCPDGSRWAVKCFTREVHGLRERYQKISAHLSQAKLPFLVDFSYLEQGIRVAGKWYPVLKMQWVEGLTLNQFVSKNLDKPAMLESLCQIWTRMASRLRAANVTHGDLQHGNILLAPGAGANSLALKLIDYDGMWTPELAKVKSGEVGHGNYQHPQRLREGTYNAEMDRFPLLLIATALRAVTVKGKALWDKYDNGDNMLFKELDLRDPAKSELFRELARMDDPTTTTLTAKMRKALAGRLETAPLLDAVLAEARPASARIKTETKTKKSGASVGVLVAAAVGLVVVLGGAAGAFVLARGSGSDKTAVKPSTELAVAPSRPVDDSEKEPLEPVGDAALTPDKSNAEKPVVVGPVPEPAVKPDEEIDLNPNGPVGEMRQFEGHTDAVARLALSPDGKQLLTASIDKTIRLWDIANGRELQNFGGQTGGVYTVLFMPDGVRALSGGEDKAVHLWDLKDGHEIRSFVGHTQHIYRVAVTPDGKIAASCGPDDVAFLWDVETGKEVRRLQSDNGGTNAVAFSPDGKVLATGSFHGPICLWNVETGKEVRRFTGHAGMVSTLTFSSDGRLVLSCGQDQTACLWNVDNGREVRRFDDHMGDLTSAALSASGQRVLTGGGAAGEVRLWDGTTAKELYRFPRRPGRILSVALSPDGRYGYSAGDDKVATMWRLPPADYVARAAEASSSEVKKSDPKQAAPDVAALAAADKEFKDVHKAELAKRKPAELQALAAKLLQEGIDTKDKPAVRFALLRGARDLAAKVADFTLAMRAVDELVNRFDVDEYEMKLQAVEAGARAAATRGANLKVAEAALPLAEEAIDGDEFDKAQRFIQIALDTSKGADNPSVRAVVDERVGEIETLRKAYEPVKAALQTLAGKPDDAAANMTLGTYLCLIKGDWSRGLPALAQGSDAKLKALAVADLGAASDPEAQVELAKKYLAQTEGESGAAKAHLQRRACYWYQKAEAKLTGISKAEATKKIAEIAKLIPHQRPAIVCAYYGTSNQWLDVTEKVRSLLLPAKGHNQTVKADPGLLGVPNPNIGQVKTMVVVYQEGGQTCLSITQEAWNGTIPAPPGAQDAETVWPAPGQELLVLAARYGAEGTWASVTTQAQHLVKGPSLSVVANDDLIGDPYAGKSKALFIVYRYGNKVRLAITAQGQTAVLGAVQAKP
jgi:WD40 repeat protein